MTDDVDSDYVIVEDAPRDDSGHPIHPEEGYRICGATKSDRTTPTSHGRERDEFDFCLLRAGWGVDDTSEGRCKHHLGAVDLRGENNPNYKHGAYSEFLRRDLTDGEADALEGMVEAFADPERAIDLIKDQAAEAYIKYKRSGDERFLREYRQLVDTFNLAPNEQRLAVDADVTQEKTLSEEDKHQLAEMLGDEPDT